MLLLLATRAYSVVVLSRSNHQLCADDIIIIIAFARRLLLLLATTPARELIPTAPLKGLSNWGCALESGTPLTEHFRN